MSSEKFENIFEKLEILKKKCVTIIQVKLSQNAADNIFNSFSIIQTELDVIKESVLSEIANLETECKVKADCLKECYRTIEELEQEKESSLKIIPKMPHFEKDKE